jgi:hypothetical protein
MGFTPDEKIQAIADAYALDACDFLRDHFEVDLDWSDDSIQQIESVMDTFHRQIAESKPSDDQVMQFAKMFGSYIGEVYRKNHGGAWGIVELDGHRVPGIKASSSDTLFWPWVRARNRLVDGSSDNVWHYFCALIER